MRLHPKMSFETGNLLLQPVHLVLESPHDRPDAIFALEIGQIPPFPATVWLRPVTRVAIALGGDTTLL